MFSNEDLNGDSVISDARSDTEPPIPNDDDLVSASAISNTDNTRSDEEAYISLRLLLVSPRRRFSTLSTTDIELLALAPK